MAAPSRDDRTLEKGRYGTVEFAIRADGTMEAKSWFDKSPVNVLASFDVLFRRLVDSGRIPNKEQFRQLDGDIWEFKRGDHRLLCYRIGPRVLLTHRIKKAGGRGKCPQGAITHAQNIAAEHFQWERVNEKGGQNK
jgi:hypothetical protein